MRYRMTKVDWALLPILVLVLAGVTWAAFRLVGFLGIGLLGLLTGLVAVNVDLQRGGPIGSVQATGLYGEFAAAQERMSRAEKAERRAELTRDQMPIFVAKVVSAGLVILGFGLFFLYQLPG